MSKSATVFTVLFIAASYNFLYSKNQADDMGQKVEWVLNHMEEKNRYENCGVKEELFPCPGKCFRQSDAGFMAFYEKQCPYCRISTSLPGGVSLKTATIFECARLGYGRRISG
jgi:lipoate synthase